ADYYFNEKQDVEQSTRHYEAVLKYPQSSAVAAARYKLAWCKINVVDFAGALALFEASVESPQASGELDIDTYRRVDVRLESLIDMAYCYPEVYKSATPEQAIAYFKRFAWSRPVYTMVLEKLAYRYYVKKRWPQAAPIYRELAMIRQDPEKLLEYAKNIFDCVQAMGTYQHAEKDVAIIVRALEGQIYSPHSAAAEKEKLVNDYELFARDIITHLHARARQTNSLADYNIVADAYKQYLDFFTKSPAVRQMAGNYAEALFSSGRYLEAGKQYEKLAPAAAVDAGLRRESLYSAVISYYRALKDKEKLNFYHAAYAREGLRSVGKIYAAEYPRSSHTPDVLFNVAWVSYDAGDYGQAIEDLSNFVSRYPRHQGAAAAVHLVMDSFHLLENYEGMIAYGKSILTSSAIQDRKLKQEVAQIVQAIGRTGAQCPGSHQQGQKRPAHPVRCRQQIDSHLSRFEQGGEHPGHSHRHRHQHRAAETAGRIYGDFQPALSRERKQHAIHAAGGPHPRRPGAVCPGQPELPELPGAATRRVRCAG
ncbi:MAG: hypothetical protein P8Z73_16870, partial [Desulfobacteraceae bacterium]